MRKTAFTLTLACNHITTMAQEGHSPVLVFDSPVMVLHSPVMVLHSLVLVFTQSSFNFYTLQFYFFTQSSFIFTQSSFIFLHSPVLFLHSPVLFFYTVQFYFLCGYQTSLALLQHLLSNGSHFVFPCDDGFNHQACCSRGTETFKLFKF